MAKMEQEARARLQQAAVALFRERGFEGTTAAAIAERAGVTERTFFRYFPDKREVLFDGQAVLMKALTASIADAPTPEAPLEILFRAFRSVVPLLEGNRPFSKPRQEVIAANPPLQERELSKLAALAEALSAALRMRGVPDLEANLAARAGIAAFADATSAWLGDENLHLARCLDEAEMALKNILAPTIV